MIKFIYFDVGGVLIKDFSKTNLWEEFRDAIGIQKEDQKEFDNFFDKYEQELCVGFDADKLVSMINNKFGTDIQDGKSFLDEFVSRFKSNDSIWPMIDELQGKYRLEFQNFRSSNVSLL